MINRKVGLYVISLELLFLFVIIITMDVPQCWSDCQLIGWWELLKTNLIPVVCILLALWGGYEYKKFKFDLEGSPHIPFEVSKIESINYEHLTFLATYVIPLVSFNFDSVRYLIVLALLLIVMGVIYIKTDLFYANPSLALLGFHIYKADGNFKNKDTRSGIILVTLSSLSVKDKVSYIKLDDRIYYVKKV